MTRPGGRGGEEHRLALALVAVAVLVADLLVLAARDPLPSPRQGPAWGDGTVRVPPASEPAVADDIPELAVGGCFTLVPTSPPTADVADCAAAHTHEAYVVAMLTDDPPDVRAAAAAAESACLEAFAPYVGTEYDASALRGEVFLPSPEAWGAGDRRLLCTVAADPDTTLVGSVRASAR